MRRLIHLAIGSVVLAIMLHTFALMGVVSPVRVSAGSMAPHLLGPHWKLTCATCSARYEVGMDAPPQAGRTECPQCAALVIIEDVEPQRGNRLYVDRATLSIAPPRRWEPIVFRCPGDARRLCVKRTVGLPGETVEFGNGDLFVDGKLVRKTLAEQDALRVLVHREREGARRWQPGNHDSAWSWNAQSWRAEARGSGKHEGPDDWLRFLPTNGKPVADRLAYNVGVPVTPNPTPDLMLTFRLTARGGGRLWVACGPPMDDGSANPLLVSIRPQQRAARIGASPRQHGAVSSPDESSPDTTLDICVSLFDRQLLVAIDGREVARRPVAQWMPPHPCPFRIAAADLDVELRDVTVWRDVVYTDRPGGPIRERSERMAWQLMKNQYFVVGDNPAISDDSRSWQHGPGLDRELLVGRPMGVR